jgi:hypothetical protein
MGVGRVAGGGGGSRCCTNVLTPKALLDDGRRPGTTVAMWTLGVQLLQGGPMSTYLVGVGCLCCLRC